MWIISGWSWRFQNIRVPWTMLNLHITPSKPVISSMCGEFWVTWIAVDGESDLSVSRLCGLQRGICPNATSCPALAQLVDSRSVKLTSKKHSL